MGIPRLMKLIQAHAPSAITTKQIKDYRGKRLAIDIMLMLYKSSIAIRNNGYDLTRSDGEVTSHIHSIFYNTRAMLKNGIIPTYVFDGKSPLIKRETLKQRKNRKDKAVNELKRISKEETPDKEKQIKQFKRTFEVTSSMIYNTKKLLSYLGIPYIQSPGEADSQSSALAMDKNTLIYGVVSEDMDHLPFGSPFLLRNFSHKKDIMEISLKEILRNFNLTHDEFIDLCILVGTEYCITIKGLGHETAYSEYKKFKNIPKLIKHLQIINKEQIKKGKNPKYIIPVDYIKQWSKAKKYYLEAKVKQPDKIITKWVSPQRDALIEFLINENEFKNAEDHIDELLLIYNDSILHNGFKNISSHSFLNYKKKNNHIPIVSYVYKSNKYHNKKTFHKYNKKS
jgi:flap endonuclease-1